MDLLQRLLELVWAQVSDPPERIVDILLKQRAQPGERVLDAGCGTGNYAIALAKGGFDVMGVDFAEGMLAQTQDKMTGNLAKRVHFRRADLNVPLAFPDKHFDHVVSISVLQAVANPTSTLKELHRVLKPGGTLILSLPRRDPPSFALPIGTLIKHRIRHLDKPTPGKILLVTVKSLGDKYHPTPTWTDPQIRELLGRVGFDTTTVIEGRQLVVVAKRMTNFKLCFC
jgi:SAM-dependent methyltransferase